MGLASVQVTRQRRHRRNICALVQRDSPDGLWSAANETREVRLSAATKTQDTSSVEESCKVPQTYSRAKVRHYGRGRIGSSEDRPSCELAEERSLAGWDDDDLEGL